MSNITIDASTGTIAGYMSFAEAAGKWGVVLGTMGTKKATRLY